MKTSRFAHLDVSGPSRLSTAYGRIARSLLAVMTLAAVAVGCSSDDGATVRDLGAEEGGSADSSDSASASASGSASASAPASGSSSATASGSSPQDQSPDSEVSADGGYEYATNVAAHRLVSADVCEIKSLLDAETIDYSAIEEVYRDGGNSVNGDGSIRTLAGFATATDRRHGLDQYYDSATPLDEFITAAIEGTGGFDGAGDQVRAQGIEKGIQNQLMVAWVRHELVSALDKADEGDFDPQEGAVHNWDEAWAFYHGAEPGCGPWATAESRAEDFGTMSSDGDGSQANKKILGAMIIGRDALLAEDADAAGAAYEEIVRNLGVTYSQATIRYASVIEDDLASDDAEQAAVHQAEGLAFWRVIEADAARSGADVDAVNAIYDPASEPGANGYGDTVRDALASFWDANGITDGDIGQLE